MVQSQIYLTIYLCFRIHLFIPTPYSLVLWQYISLVVDQLIAHGHITCFRIGQDVSVRCSPDSVRSLHRPTGHAPLRPTHANPASAGPGYAPGHAPRRLVGRLQPRPPVRGRGAMASAHAGGHQGCNGRRGQMSTEQQGFKWVLLHERNLQSQWLLMFLILFRTLATCDAINPTNVDTLILQFPSCY